MTFRVRREPRPDTWSVADDAELKDLADQYPIVAKALQHWKVVQFSVVGYVPRTPVHNNKVQVS